MTERTVRYSVSPDVPCSLFKQSYLVHVRISANLAMHDPFW